MPSNKNAYMRYKVLDECFQDWRRRYTWKRLLEAVNSELDRHSYAPVFVSTIRADVESLKADNRQKEMNLSKDYVSEWRTFIAEPLQLEVSEIRQEVAELRCAIQRIGDCSHRAECPVLEQLQRQPKGE